MIMHTDIREGKGSEVKFEVEADNGDLVTIQATGFTGPVSLLQAIHRISSADVSLGIVRGVHEKTPVQFPAAAEPPC